MNEKTKNRFALDISSLKMFIYMVADAYQQITHQNKVEWCVKFAQRKQFRNQKDVYVTEMTLTIIVVAVSIAIGCFHEYY